MMRGLFCQKGDESTLEEKADERILQMAGEKDGKVCQRETTNKCFVVVSYSLCCEWGFWKKARRERQRGRGATKNESKEEEKLRGEGRETTGGRGLRSWQTDRRNASVHITT